MIKIPVDQTISNPLRLRDVIEWGMIERTNKNRLIVSLLTNRPYQRV